MKKIICKIGLVLVLAAVAAQATRVKDVASLDGLSNQQLVGYGLVVGLAGTGDGSNTAFTVQSVVNMLKKLGIEVPADKMRLRNVAAVMVTAELAPFVKPGRKVDVTISSLGDARSLEGGTLLMTPMQAADGEYYVMAQGAVSVGGSFVADSKQRARVQKNHTLAGNIPEGGIVKREVDQAALSNGGALRWVLSAPDFSSAVAMAEAINKIFPASAQAEDASTVAVAVPVNLRADLMAFIAKSENAEFAVSSVARVVLNEKTGTLVSGADVRISEVAVSHGSVVINVDAKESASQPNALSQGRTASVVNETVAMNAPASKPEVKVIPQVTSAGQLAQALNALGVEPRDIISIFQAIKRAGALQAELIVM
jgi:flagellar P-ring protein precursor FlgI